MKIKTNQQINKKKIQPINKNTSQNYCIIYLSLVSNYTKKTKIAEEN
jgi:hypothetical protein